ncbi:hypothetical protein PEC302107_30170 [Pectobacterium araliae]|uniref:Uncharacterized protein n=1 Tax=Pectobacterium araliae TaxID=3073862 RepID=A0AAN0MMR2_9GAMM|nr:hypothetical protein PEC302110_35000 [Pectobacterium sp. MAFF 302110]GKW21288.1 hypothetical protein PEC302107_30170 [Pectobacterium carotovorum subsp. carotovorum]
MSLFKSSNIIKITAFFITCIGFMLLLPYLFVNASYSYTKDDYIKYHFLTFKEVKEMPFISTNYSIEYDSPDGTSGSTNSVFFSNVNLEKKSEIINYLNKLGFKKHEDMFWIKSGEIWKKGDNSVSVIQDHERKIIIISFEKK